MLLVPLLTCLYFTAVSFNRLAGFLFQFKDNPITSLILGAEYPVETHDVITKDGYKLKIHRIPHGRNSSAATKGPVFLMHGLLCSSADWVVSGSNSLGFSLAEAGFDVWMGNNRGNTYSRFHEVLKPDYDDAAFFQYSYDEIGQNDLPAMIDYVLKKTNQTQLGYVGFSEGVTSFFVLMNYHPEYNKNISTAIAWAPVTDMYETTSKPINAIAQSKVLEWLVKQSKLYELLPYRKVGNSFRALCRTFDKLLCNWIFSLLGSSDEHMPTKDFKAEILNNFPAGMSMKQVLHYAQGARTGIFKPYDYGSPEENLKVYHKVQPDPYDLSKVTVPMTLYYGDSDIYVNNYNLLTRVVKQLGQAEAIEVDIKNFNHLDFIWNKENDWLITETRKKLEEAANAKQSLLETA